MLREYGQHRWRHHRNEWRQATQAIIVIVFLVGVTACTNNGQWRRQYEESTRKLQDGYFEAALKLADDGETRAEGKSAEWYWRFRIIHAEADLSLLHPGEALSLTAAQLPEAIPAEIRAHAMLTQASALCQLHREREAFTILAASDLNSANLPAIEAERLLDRGSCALDSDLAAAKRDFDRSAELAAGRDQFLLGSALLGSGYVLLTQRNFDGAIGRLLPALDATTSPFIRERTLGNLGLSYSQLGEYRTAIQYSGQAAEIATQLGLSDDESAWLLDVGHSYQALHEFADAESYLQRALSLSRRLNDHVNEAGALNNLTRMALKDHQLEKAERYWREEASIANVSPVTKSYSAMDEAEIALARKDYHRAEAVLDVLVADANANAVLHAITLGNLAQVYADEQKFDSANKMFLRSVEAAEKARSKVSESFRMSFLDEFPFYDAYVQFLLKQHKAMAALQIAERGRAITLMEGIAANRLRRTEPDLRSIQSFLKSRNETLLTYWVTEEQSYLWLISPRYFKVFYLPGHKELHELVEAANKEIQNRVSLQNSTRGEELYKTVIAPASRFIQQGSKVMVIPSRVLCLTSFEALVSPEPNPHYWIEDVEIQKTSSISLMLLNSEDHAPVPAKELLLIGAPVEVDKKSFPALPHAMDEIQDIEPHFNASRETVISGKDATPQAYLESHPEQYRVIHFVTHGTANEQHPLDSAIVLSPGPQNAYMLYAGEIVKKPIDADLVTISACYGAGLRWYLSESTVGLGWAFIRAGAHHVIAALWEVDDEGTPEFMDDFYRQFSSGKTCAEALRAVKLKMIQQQGPHRHPYFWASLEVYAGS